MSIEIVCIHFGYASAAVKATPFEVWCLPNNVDKVVHLLCSEHNANPDTLQTNRYKVELSDAGFVMFLNELNDWSEW